MGTFQYFLLWAVCGVAIMYYADAGQGFALTRSLRERWWTWLPYWLPNAALTLFWPIGLVWALWRR